jgi:hypothetical protein
VQREIVDYAHLNRTALAAIKTIIETTRNRDHPSAFE